MLKDFQLDEVLQSMNETYFSLANLFPLVYHCFFSLCPLQYALFVR